MILVAADIADFLKSRFTPPQNPQNYQMGVTPSTTPADGTTSGLRSVGRFEPADVANSRAVPPEVLFRKPLWLFYVCVYQSSQGSVVPKMGPNGRFLGKNIFSLIAPRENPGRLLGLGL